MCVYMTMNIEEYKSLYGQGGYVHFSKNAEIIIQLQKFGKKVKFFPAGQRLDELKETQHKTLELKVHGNAEIPAFHIVREKLLCF